MSVCVCECACLKGGCKCAFSSCKRLDQLQSIQQTFNNNNSNNNKCAKHYAINIRAGVKMCKMFGVNSSEMTCETLWNCMKRILQQLKFNTFNGFTLKTSRITIRQPWMTLKALELSLQIEINLLKIKFDKFPVCNCCFCSILSMKNLLYTNMPFFTSLP